MYTNYHYNYMYNDRGFRYTCNHTISTTYTYMYTLYVDVNVRAKRRRVHKEGKEQDIWYVSKKRY